MYKASSYRDIIVPDGELEDEYFAGLGEEDQHLQPGQGQGQALGRVVRGLRGFEDCIDYTGRWNIAWITPAMAFDAPLPPIYMYTVFTHLQIHVIQNTTKFHLGGDHVHVLVRLHDALDAGQGQVDVVLEVLLRAQAQGLHLSRVV